MKDNVPRNYWKCEGKKIIAIPTQVLKKQRLNNALLNGLFVKDLGYYPVAENYYTRRKEGSAYNILIFCVGGAGWVKNASGIRKVTENSFFILPQNIEHEYGASDDDPWTIYSIKFGGNMLANINDMSFTRDCFNPKHFLYKKEAIQLFNEIFTMLEQGYDKEYLAYVNMKLVTCLTLFLFQRDSIVKKDTENSHDIIIRKAMAYMQSNLHRSILLPDVSAAAGCSDSQLSTIFKSTTGYSPINYFNQLKIQKACQLFYGTNGLVKEVAAQLGYNDPYYFSRLFTQLMGTSPNEYRNRNTKLTKVQL
jgi:AraC family transcriptional regulator of arabinose operon